MCAVVLLQTCTTEIFPITCALVTHVHFTLPWQIFVMWLVVLYKQHRQCRYTLTRVEKDADQLNHALHMS